MLSRGWKKFCRKPFCLVFSLEIETLLRIVGALSTFLAKKSGMGLQNPVMSAQEKYTSLLRASGELIGAVKGKPMFSTADHIREVNGGRRDKKKERDTTNDAKLKVVVCDQVDIEKLLLLHDKHTCA